MTDIRETIHTLDEIYSDHITKMTEPTINPQLEIISKAITRVENLFASKNAEYSGGADILGNFRRQAGQQGVPMSTAWMFLAGKHIDAIQECNPAMD